MQIRKAIEKDIDNLHALLTTVQQLHADGRPDIFIGGATKYTKGEIGEILACETTPVYVLVDDKDCAVGYAFCSINVQKKTNNLKEVKSFYIDDLCIDSSLRGKGYGTKLYEYVKGEAKKEGCYHLTLNVWHLNESAEKFYLKLGMRPLKTAMEEIL